MVRAAHRTLTLAAATLFAAASEARSPRERHLALRRLGDLALFMAGFFPDALARKPVDVDYYIRMGGSAYGTLANSPAATTRERAFTAVFRELAGKFGEFVEAIGEISDSGRRYTPRDILRLYERWLATGSARARQRLDEHGPMMALRFAGDKLCTADKFQALDRAFNTDKKRISLLELPGKGHSVLTLDLISGGAPAQQALDDVLSYFDQKLRG